ncbi:unnamed protein product [Ranitomeya imitator]|uniref:Nucleoside-diphosphate kinase n=1 Tax=Ranitomeya imitator TaxID=111125 RepID=A0ABN9LJ95_9NEOB|nr:unnamed protein product [Ranitomeya imitator]
MPCSADPPEIPDALWARLIQERLSEVDCVRRVRNIVVYYFLSLTGDVGFSGMDNDGWVMEGFPRTREQGLLLQMNGTSPDHIVVLDAPDIVLIERNMGKRIDPSTGEIYHTTFDWPEDPEVQRNLVEPAGISEHETGKRLLEYQRNMPGILRAFPKIHKKINADQPCMDVFSQVLTFVLSKPRSLAPYTPRILLYGPPGSGRSLQAALLAQKYDIVNVSCGQVLKEAMADQTKIGLLIEPYIENEQQAFARVFLPNPLSAPSKVLRPQHALFHFPDFSSPFDLAVYPDRTGIFIFRYGFHPCAAQPHAAINEP